KVSPGEQVLRYVPTGDFPRQQAAELLRRRGRALGSHVGREQVRRLRFAVHARELELVAALGVPVATWAVAEIAEVLHAAEKGLYHLRECRGWKLDCAHALDATYGQVVTGDSNYRETSFRRLARPCGRARETGAERLDHTTQLI